jgi:hypothetical protein
MTISRSNSPPLLAAVCDDDRFAAIEEFADKGASFWRSIAEAAYRGDRLTVEVHCRQVAAVTRAAFQIVKTLGAEAAESRAA